MSEKLESKELERKQEEKKIEDADKLLMAEGEEKKGAEIANRAGTDLLEKSKGGKEAELAAAAWASGKNLYSEIAASRNGSEGSGGVSEMAEFKEKADVAMKTYQGKIEASAAIEDPKERKKAVETAYFELKSELEGIRWLQEGRDADNNTKRQEKNEKDMADKDRKRRLEFAEAIVKASHEIEVDQKLQAIQNKVEDRLKNQERTRQESLAKAREAMESIGSLA